VRRGERISRDTPCESTDTKHKRPINSSNAASRGRSHVAIGKTVRVKVDHEVSSRQRVLRRIMEEGQVKRYREILFVGKGDEWGLGFHERLVFE
jgi:hypothetical protein